MPDHLTTAAGRRIAFSRSSGQGPGIVFLGGFMSDIEGTKALWLHDRARWQNRPFLRFDYSGHGASEGAFEDGTIGDWAADARAAIEGLTDGPQILVGSSMGGWISLILAGQIPDRIAAIVAIAAAPDFTEDGYWAGFTAAERAEITRAGKIEVPSDYDAPYTITMRLIEDGRRHLVLRQPLALPFPVRLLQGSEDEAVSRDVALRLFDHAEGPDIRLTLVKGADHRFSSPRCLDLIGAAVDEVAGLVS